MICFACQTGMTQPGETIANFEQSGTVVALKGVPAEICDNCGEIYLDDRIALQLMVQMEAAMRDGVEIREFDPAL
jgi:YgiT-type zinc finger domain-containing protein